MSTCFGETAAIRELGVLKQWERKPSPLYVRVTGSLKKAAREYVTETFGYQMARDCSDQRIVEIYLGIRS